MKLAGRSGLVFLCLGYLAIATFYPFRYFPEIATTFAGIIREFFAPAAQGPALLLSRDFLLNLIFFVPFGLLFFYFIRPLPRFSGMAAVLLVSACGLGTSLLIESGQVFFQSRFPSITDVAANSLGAFGGALLSLLLVRHGHDPVSWFWTRFSHSAFLLKISLVLALIPLITTVTRHPWHSLHNWDPNFTLQVGNEATMNRPWNGDIHFLAIYDHALSDAEIRLRSTLGWQQAKKTAQERDQAIVLYAFGEQAGVTTRDESEFLQPLNLVMTEAPDQGVLASRSMPGVLRGKRTGLASRTAARKVSGLLQRSGEFTIETWITPATLDQTGPARIVTISDGPDRRNVTLGQDFGDIEFRVRTPATGINASTARLRTTDGFLRTGTTQITAIYREGIASLYVNGDRHPDSLNIKEDVILGMDVPKTRLSRLAFAFAYFFPLSLFGAAFAAKRRSAAQAALIGFSAALLLVMGTDAFQSFMTGRAADLDLLTASAAVLFLGAASGAATRPKSVDNTLYRGHHPTPGAGRREAVGTIAEIR
jgi:glycopeptide antibiotics resistance protein